MTSSDDRKWFDRRPGWLLPVGTAIAVALAAGGALLGPAGLVAGCVVLAAWFFFLIAASPNGPAPEVERAPFPWWRRLFAVLWLGGWIGCLGYGYWLEEHHGSAEAVKQWIDGAWAILIFGWPIDVALQALARRLAKRKS